MRKIIKSYLESVEQIKSLKNRSNELIKEILDYKFERGKYRGMAVHEIVLKNPSYVSYWINSNLPYTSSETLELPIIISDSAKRLRELERMRKEQEYEKRRMKWCESHGEDYSLDYDIRHNRNLRDFGM